MWNDGKVEARLRWEIRPALRTETYSEQLFGLVGAGRPNLLRLAVLFHTFRDEFRLSRPAQRVLFGLLAALGHRRGYQATPPGYGVAESAS